VTEVKASFLTHSATTLDPTLPLPPRITARIVDIFKTVCSRVNNAGAKPRKRRIQDSIEGRNKATKTFFFFLMMAINQRYLSMDIRPELFLSVGLIK
jgi:hypothetical protein